MSARLSVALLPAAAAIRCEVVVLGAGVDDDVERAGPGRIERAADHQVVDGAAVLVEQQRVAELAGLQAGDVAARPAARSARRRRAWSASASPDFSLSSRKRRAHVRDVEQAGVLAGPFVLGDDAGGILHRHASSRANGTMRPPSATCRSLRTVVLRASASAIADSRTMHGVRHPRGCAVPPLSGEPERFPRWPMSRLLLR